LVADAAVGFTLLAVSAAGVVGAVAADQTWWLVVVGCAAGAAVSIRQVRYAEADSDELAAAPSVGDVPVEPLWRLPLRNLPSLLAASVLIAAGALLTRDVLGVIAGLVGGRALMELRLAFLYSRWERRHGRRPYGTTGRFRPILQRTDFEELYVERRTTEG
jgi:hypothetical protein